MNGLKKLLGGIVLAALSVAGFFLFATVGLAVLLVVLGLLFVGALALRWKKPEAGGSSFRVITFGLPTEGRPMTEDPFTVREMRRSPPQAPQGPEAPHVSGSGACVELSPEDYRKTDGNETGQG